MILYTTTYTIWRAGDIDEDAGDELEWEVHLAGVKGNTVYLSGGESMVGGARERLDARVLIDPVDVKHYDHIVDDKTGERWEVSFARHRTGLGLDHMVVGVYAVTGTSRGTRDL